jgi:quinol monooxygenase YgiN
LSLEAVNGGAGTAKVTRCAAAVRAAPHTEEKPVVLIVGGWFEVDPSERDAFVAGRIESVRSSRAEQGCIEYVIAADPVDPGRAVLFERWESQADLDAHLARPRPAPPSDAPPIAPTSVSIRVYDVTGERSLS